MNAQGPLLHNYDWRKNLQLRNTGWAGQRRISVESSEKVPKSGVQYLS